MASAAYATNAGTASTAVNALKLGGYEASEYLRKDEVKTLTAAYQEIEWTTPGTYNWVVPEGVNSILVTTVGGGGGCGYCRVRNNLAVETATDAYFHMFGGGGGGEVTPNVVVKVTPGETLQIVVGAGGRNAVTLEDMRSTNPLHGHLSPTVSSQRGNTDGGDGGRSYIARNGAAVAGTNANGGGGGKGYYHYSHTDALGKIFYFADGGKAGGKNSTDGRYTYFYYYGGVYIGVRTNEDTYSGYKGAASGESNTRKVVSYGAVNPQGEPVMHGTYGGSGGGASWGNGSGADQLGGVGSGGSFSENWLSLNPGNGMVKILAIGLTSD